METMKREDPELARLVNQVEEPHRELHESVLTVERYFSNGNISRGKQYYMNNT
ncbi:MAG: hypothetical protein KGY60_10910 [Bacteroidales bacterium]|nr:hypothetical protein [Bacteroidales bacterium]